MPSALTLPTDGSILPIWPRPKDKHSGIKRAGFERPVGHYNGTEHGAVVFSNRRTGGNMTFRGGASGEGNGFAADVLGPYLGQRLRTLKALYVWIKLGQGYIFPIHV